MRARNVLVIAAALAGCAFDNGGNNNGSDDGGTGSDDPGPCMLADINLPAATLSGCSDANTTDGVRGTAKFSNPVNVALGPSGIAYVVDFDSSLRRRGGRGGGGAAGGGGGRGGRPGGGGM